MTSSALGSSVDQLSTGSPDQESNPSAEANGILQEDNGSEAFGVLELPESALDPVDEESGTRKEPSQCDHTPDTDLLNGVLDLPLRPGEKVGGSDIISGLEEEPAPADSAAGHAQLCLRKQESSAEAREVNTVECSDPQSTFSEAPLLDSLMVPSSLSWPPGAEQWLPEMGVYEVHTEETSPEPDILTHVEVPSYPGSNPWHVVTNNDTGQKEMPTSECAIGNVEGQVTPLTSALVASTHEHWLDQPFQDQAVTSSDEEDIYAHGLPSSSSETSVAELGADRSLQDLSQPGNDDTTLLKTDQVCVLMEEV